MTCLPITHPGRLLALVLLAALLFTASGTQVAAPAGVSRLPGWDKVAHFLLYGLFATMCLRLNPKAPPSLGRALFAIFAASAFGLADEFRQYLNPHRFFEWDDAIANTLGAILATLLYLYWKPYRAVLEWKIPFPGNSK